MTSLLEIPNYELAAKSLHSTSHGVVDSTPGYICTETSSNTSFTENNILRVKEIRCDRNRGKIRTTGIIISNKNQVQAGQVVPDSAIYDNVGGFSTATIVTFGNTSNTSALVVKSGGAYIGDGANVVGTVTANQLTVSGTSSFTGVMSLNGGFSGNIQYGTLIASTRINAPEIDNGTDTNMNYKRNGITIFSLDKIPSNLQTPTHHETLTLSNEKYLKRNGCPRFFAAKQSPNGALTFTIPSGSGPITSYGTELVDQGNCFDPTTGTFTAPIAGCYRFFFSIGTSSTIFYLMIYKNGADTGLQVYNQEKGGVTCYGLDILINLSQNDSIQLYYPYSTYPSRLLFGGMLVSLT